MFQKKQPQNTGRQTRREIPQRKEVLSYHASRSPREDKKSTRRADFLPDSARQQHRWWRNVPMIIAGLLIAASMVDMLLLNANPKVVILDDSGSVTSSFLHSEAVYEQAAQKLFQHSLFDRTKVTVNTASISQALEQEFPELSNVSVALPLIGHRAVVYVTPDPPSLILVSENGSSFAVSVSGKALGSVSAASEQSNSLKLPIVKDQSGLVVQVGKPALPPSNVSFIQAVTQQLQAQHVAIQSLSLPLAAAELDVQLTGQPYFVKFNLEADAKQQIGTFISTKDYLAAHSITPAHYIDVQVLGRAYYQ